MLTRARPLTRYVSFAPGTRKISATARVLDHVLDTVDPIVAAPIGDQQCAAVILDLDEARLVALGRTVEPVTASCRQDKKRGRRDEGTSHRIDVVDFLPEDTLCSISCLAIYLICAPAATAPRRRSGRRPNRASSGLRQPPGINEGPPRR